MELIDLPPNISCLNHHHIVDWTPAAPIEAQPELLQHMNKGRSRQSETSRKRQAFISGMMYRPTAQERMNKRVYLEEWHLRIIEND